MKCVNCGGVLSSSGCTLCGAGWITPAAIKEYWATMAYKELEAEMLHLSEQRDRLWALVKNRNVYAEHIGKPQDQDGWDTHDLCPCWDCRCNRLVAECESGEVQK